VAAIIDSLLAKLPVQPRLHPKQPYTAEQQQAAAAFASANAAVLPHAYYSPAAAEQLQKVYQKVFQVLQPPSQAVEEKKKGEVGNMGPCQVEVGCV
jgi:hypothetical protein